MAILTKAQILTGVNHRLNRHGLTVPEIDDELQSVLYDITSRDEFLKADTAITTVSGTNKYAHPAGMTRYYGINRSGGNRLGEITWENYNYKIRGLSALPNAEPTDFASYDGNWYLWPEPGAVYSFVVNHAHVHAGDLSDLELDATFKRLIVEGVLADLFLGQLAPIVQNQRNVSPDMAFLHTQRYEQEMMARTGVLRKPHARVKYNDI